MPRFLRFDSYQSVRFDQVVVRFRTDDEPAFHAFCRASIIDSTSLIEWPLLRITNKGGIAPIQLARLRLRKRERGRVILQVVAQSLEQIHAIRDGHG